MNKSSSQIDIDTHARRMMATDAVTDPEILQRLANDPDAGVRIGVAANETTPLKAQVLLALDKRDDVRTAIAQRADLLVARLAQIGVPHAAALAMHTLEALALDQAVNVRVALASSLKDVAMAPPAIIRKLAHDITREVAEPILRYCLALSDDDLIAVIAARHDDWSRSVIAARPKVSAQVSAAIIASNDDAAIVTLLDNNGAEIAEPQLTQLTERAETAPSLQASLAARPTLPPHLARRLAEFVEEKVLCILRQRDDFDAATTEDILQTVKRRVSWATTDAALTGEEKARRMFLCGMLGETQISDALSWNEQEFVRHALALLARMPEPIVGAILKSQSPRAVTALAWRGKLSMRCALLLQMRAANIPADRLLNARGGTDYPDTEVAMRWQLEMFGVSM